MPTLKYFAAAGGPRLYSIHKPVTTVGKALGNDVAVIGKGVAENHVQVLFDGRDFVLEEIDRDADIAINGKRKRRARLVHGDRVQLGAVELGFDVAPPAWVEPGQWWALIRIGCAGRLVYSPAVRVTVR